MKRIRMNGNILPMTCLSVVAALTVACGAQPSDGMGSEAPATNTEALSFTSDTQAMSSSSVGVAPSAWRRTLTQSSLPKGGCFQAKHPGSTWSEVPCVRPPEVPFVPAGGSRLSPSGSTMTVGDGVDNSSQVSGTISWAEGTFPRVSGVTSADSSNYSLQLNSSTFNTSVCNGAASPSSCGGWEQFVYASGVAFIQYWLINYGNTCPSGWNTYYSDCWRNSDSGVSVGTLAATSLPDIALIATASSSSDSVAMSIGDTLYTYNQSGSILHLNSGWNTAEFNIFGNGGGSQYNFSGSSVAVVVQTLTNSVVATKSAPSCDSAGFTGETNSLSLVSNSCCPIGGNLPGIQFMESNLSSPKAQSCPLMTDTVCATSPNQGGVFRYSSISASWTQIGGAANTLYGGSYGLFATSPSNGNIFQYQGTPNSWTQVGGPGSEFAVTNEGLYGLTSARDAVFRYNGTGTSWTQVGSAAAHIYGGTDGLFATNPSSGNIFQYLPGSNSWTQVGGPGSQFATTDEALYGLSTNGGGVFRYNGTGTSWTQVGGAAANIYGGGYGLFATNPSSGNIFRFLGTPNNWTQVGGPGTAFTVTEEGLYGLNSGGVFRYNGSGTSWSQIGGPAYQIVSCP